MSHDNEIVSLSIESLAHDGRGVGRYNGKAVFVDGALPGETANVWFRKRRRKFDEAILDSIISPSPDRVEPRCPHFQQCGGCSLQHLHSDAQILHKQQLLHENLKRIGKVLAESTIAPLQADLWGYRRKARLGVRYVRKKERVLVGFREKGSSFITDTQSCAVLHPSVGAHIALLAHTIGTLSIRDCIPQIEVAIGSERGCLVFRVLAPLSEGDRERLLDLERQIDLRILIQPGGVDSVYPLTQGDDLLGYRLPESDVEFHFKPLDFTQVNQSINRKMVAQALHYLQLDPQDTVLDLFCGLGNFSLPMARQAARIIGIEGDAGMVQRAQDNALANQIDNCTFYQADLFDWESVAQILQRDNFNKLLLDPPRSGAESLVRGLAAAGTKPERIVYISCNPATLARDVGILVGEADYRLIQSGVMDMFPHTAHTEAMAVLEQST